MSLFFICFPSILLFACCYRHAPLTSSLGLLSLPASSYPSLDDMAPSLASGPSSLSDFALEPIQFPLRQADDHISPSLSGLYPPMRSLLRAPRQKLFGPCSLRLSIADLTRGLGIQSSRSHVLNYVITLSTMYVGAACQLLTLHEYLIPSSSGCLVRFDDGGILPHPICMISLLVLGDSNLPSTSVHRHLSTAVYNPMADPISHIYMHE